MLNVRKKTEKYSRDLAALHSNRSQTGCWKNNYWIPIGSLDVNKSELVPQLSDTAQQRQDQASVYCKTCVILTIYFISPSVDR